jgi:cardiolipin synthase
MPRRSVFGKNLPNLISVARLVMAPVAVWLIIIGEFRGALWLFLLAGASDALDGILARWLRARSLLGSYLDPIADKALLMGVFFALGFQGVLPLWLVVLVVSRDIFILGGHVLLHTLLPGEPMIRPSLISKLNTGLQIFLAGGALAEQATTLLPVWFLSLLVWGTALTTIASGVGYLTATGRRLAGLEREA